MVVLAWRSRTGVNPSVLCGFLVVLSVVMLAPVARGGPLPPEATLLVADLLITPWYTPQPVISPDGKKIAYCSAGSLFVCDVAGGPPRELVRIPNTMSAILAEPEYVHCRGDEQRQSQLISSKDFRKKVFGRMREFREFKWTRTGDGILYAIDSPRVRHGARPKCTVQYVSESGTTSELVEVPFGQAGLRGCDLVGVEEFLLLDYGSREVFYDQSAERFREPVLAHSVVSSDGRRVLGIEVRSKRLVLVDEHLRVVRRFAQRLPDSSHGLALLWSPDEKFILWRNRIGYDHFSNWVGFRMNLETGETRELSGRFFDQRFAFTGRGGELIRWGQTGVETTGYDAVIGAHLTIIPDRPGPVDDVWRIVVRNRDELPGSLTNRPGNPPLFVGPQGSFFALGIPRPRGQTSGWVWHLITRDGRTWRLPGEDSGAFVSPYKVVGFADGGCLIIARDETRIFAIPVPARW